MAALMGMDCIEIFLCEKCSFHLSITNYFKRFSAKHLNFIRPNHIKIQDPNLFVALPCALCNIQWYRLLAAPLWHL